VFNFNLSSSINLWREVTIFGQKMAILDLNMVKRVTKSLLILYRGGANAKKVYIFNLKTPIYPKIIYFFTHLYTRNIIFWRRFSAILIIEIIVDLTRKGRAHVSQLLRVELRQFAARARLKNN